MKQNLLSLALLLAVAAGALSGCGSDDPGRPSVEDISSGLTSEFADTDTSAELISCVAKALHDSDLSDDALRAVSEQDEDFEASKGDQAAIAEVSASAGKRCADSAADPSS
jgi:hypothetical protein